LPSFLSQVLTLLGKDLKIEVRSRLDAWMLFVFSLASGATIGFISKSSEAFGLSAAAGTISIVQLFLSTFASWKSFVREHERGTLTGLLLTPASPASLFYAKLIYSAVLIELSSVFAIVSSAFFSGGYMSRVGTLLLGSLAMGIYMSAVASFSSVVVVYAESRGLLIPLVTIALSLPAMIYFSSSVYDLRGLALLALIGVAYGLVVTSLADLILGEE